MAIEFIDVKYKNIFNNLNLKINEGQITSIIGKNSRGKTSFLNLIFGLDLNFIGKINIDKKSISNKTKNKELTLIRNNIFYLKQDFYTQLYNVTVFDDIKCGITSLDNNKLEELLKSFNLDTKILAKNYCELSLGERKKILLISMLVSNNKIILLDDPTSHLEQKSVSSLVKMLKKLKRKGKIIVIASQDSEFLINISDRIIILDKEKLIDKENKYEVLSDLALLKKCHLNMPNVLQFKERVLKRKNIKLVYRDNINDLLKDIYRNAK